METWTIAREVQKNYNTLQKFWFEFVHVVENVIQHRHILKNLIRNLTRWKISD